LQPLLKPQARDIYFKRKIELTNLVAQKKQRDKNDMQMFLKLHKVKHDNNTMTNKIKEIMTSYDIHHPLRGEE
jgi:hypothetical protein